jgi:hypothetical protein
MTALLATSVPAYTGPPETRQWSICEQESVAISIGEIYEEFGGETAFWTWERAAANDLCFYRYGPMTVGATIYRARDLRVVRVLESTGKVYYWVTLEKEK